MPVKKVKGGYQYGTTGIVSMNNGRNYVGIDLNPGYNEIAERRFEKECTNVFIVEKRL